MKTKRNRKQWQRLLALGLAGLLLTPQAALAEDRTYDGDAAKLRTIGPHSYSFGPAILANTSGNTIIINYTSGTAPVYVFGAYSNSEVTNNKVLLEGGTVDFSVYGGYSDSGSANGNTVTLSDGSVEGIIFGGYSRNSSAANNTVIVSGGTVNSIVGGWSDSGATYNTVVVSGGNVIGDVCGGFSKNGSKHNTFTISGGIFGGFVVGGDSLSGGAINNTVTISGSPDLKKAVLFGGFSRTGTGDVRSGNTLNVKSAEMSSKGVQNFQYYNFYLPPALASGGTMLSVTDPADIAGSTIGVGIDGTTTALRPGDRVTLLHTGGLTATGLNTRAVGLVGIAKIYDFDLTTDANNLYATAVGSDPGPGPDPIVPRLNPQVKALSEGQISSAAFLTHSGDLLAGQGIAGAHGAATAAGGQTTGFAALGGSSLRYATGSHVNVNGFSLIVGAAKEQAAANGTKLGGLFLETGWGNYSTHNQFAAMSTVRGDGDTRYFGAGWLGRSQKGDGRYLEGSLRAGKVHNKFHSGDFGVAGESKEGNYDVSAPYYGLHIGIGQEKAIGTNQKRDIYTKLLWTHQSGSNATIAGDAFDFAAVDSYRWQLGAKLSRKVNDQTTLRTGLTYQYEFGGKANATANGSEIEAPSLKGSTGILEVGLTKESKDGKGASLDFSLQGLFGKAKGMAGNVQASWKF